MNLKIVLPLRTFAEIKNVCRISAETSEGPFGLSPQKLDCVATVIPCIFKYETDPDNIHYLVVDEGVLIKAGSQVVLTVCQAFGEINHHTTP
jgi:F-type H+-transporting ATPase subunit epsilon